MATGPFSEKPPKIDKSRKQTVKERSEAEQLEGWPNQEVQAETETEQMRTKPPKYKKPSQPREPPTEATQRPELQKVGGTDILFPEPPSSPQFARELTEEPLRIRKVVEKRDMEIQTVPVQKSAAARGSSRMDSTGSKPKHEAASKRHPKTDFKVKINEEIEQDEIKAKRI